MKLYDNFSYGCEYCTYSVHCENDLDDKCEHWGECESCEFIPDYSDECLDCRFNKNRPK